MNYVHLAIVLFLFIVAGTAYNVSVNASPTPVLPTYSMPNTLVASTTIESPTHTLSKVTKATEAEVTLRTVPFYSQFTDISRPEWKKIGCGIASLAMILDYYKPAVSVDTLLARGIARDAYLSNAGWTYKGLIDVGQEYGLTGDSYDLAGSSSSSALSTLETYLADGPIIASVHYTFDPANPIPHLVVINRIEGDRVYYNDPAADKGNKTISTDTFMKAWKKRFIVIRPA